VWGGGGGGGGRGPASREPIQLAAARHVYGMPLQAQYFFR